MTRIDILIRYLIAEDPQYSEIQIPEDLQGKRDLFRALRNVREPKPVSEEFLRLQDEELQAQLQEKGIVELIDIVGVCRGEKFFAPTGKQLSLWQGDITRLRVDAIVNAANAQMLGCFHPLHRCIDNAIHSAAGVQLREESPTASRQNPKGNNWPPVTEALWLVPMSTVSKASPSAASPRESSASRTSWPPKSPCKPSRII